MLCQKKSSLNGIGSLAMKLVQTKQKRQHRISFSLFTYQVSVDFTCHYSAMKIVKNRLRNRTGDQFLNECLFHILIKMFLTK